MRLCAWRCPISPVKLRYLNGFVLIGVALLVISAAGIVTGNRFLTEPGQAVNPFSWLLYLAAAVLMLINGGVSIWTARQPGGQAQGAAEAAESTAESAANSEAPKS